MTLMTTDPDENWPQANDANANTDLRVPALDALPSESLWLGGVLSGGGGGPTGGSEDVGVGGPANPFVIGWVA